MGKIEVEDVLQEAFMELEDKSREADIMQVYLSEYIKELPLPEEVPTQASELVDKVLKSSKVPKALEGVFKRLREDKSGNCVIAEPGFFTKTHIQYLQNLGYEVSYNQGILIINW